MSFHPSIADIAVIGVQDDRWGERPLALAVLKPGYQETNAEDILALGHQAVAKGYLPKYGVPSELIFIEQMPKTSVGKLNKTNMRLRCAEKMMASQRVLLLITKTVNQAY